VVDRWFACSPAPAWAAQPDLDALVGRALSEADAAEQAEREAVEALFASALGPAWMTPRALDAMVAAALDSAGAVSPVGCVAEVGAEPRAGVARPTPRALWRSALAAAAVAVGSVALDRGLGLSEAWPRVATVVALGRELLSTARAVDRLVVELVPGGWGGAALALVLALIALLLPLGALLRGGVRPLSGLIGRGGVGTNAFGVLLAAAAFALYGSNAHALDFTGEWPEAERVTLHLDGVRASEALRRAAEAAGLGYVGALPADPEVSVHVDGVPLRAVVTAVLGTDAPLTATRADGMLVLRPKSAPGTLPLGTPVAGPRAHGPEPAAPPSASPVDVAPGPLPADAAPPAAPTAPPGPPARGHDRITLGGDVHVRPGERVGNVVTFGGDALIEGVVDGDVVTLGGDVDVRAGGVVRGELVLLGGELRLADGAVAPRASLSLGDGGLTARVRDGVGERLRDGAGDRGPRARRERGWLPRGPFGLTSRARRAAERVSDALSSAARHALLFLFGLLLVALAPARLERVQRAVARAPLQSAAVGLLSVAVALLAIAALVITVVGIPAAAIVGLGSALALYAGLVAVAAAIGRLLPVPALRDRPIAQLGSGVLMLWLVGLVPVVGGLLSWAVALLGLGAVVFTRGGEREA
jgi:hypothetical protein